MAKILLMDDDFALGVELARDLGKLGHDLLIRSNATDAKEELLRDRYDLLIADMIVKVDGHAVPDGGIALIAWVRRTERLRKMPIIGITGTYKYPGMEHILDTALQVGADASLTKPIVLEDLLTEIDLLTQESGSSANQLTKP